MKIELLKNAFKPDGSKAPTILRKGEITDVTDEEGKTLVEKGYAVEFKPKAEKKTKEKDSPTDSPAAK